MTVGNTNVNPRTRQKILDALENLLSTQALGDISIADILAEAGLASRTSYYRQFNSRDEAFVALARHALDEINTEVRATIADTEARSTPALRHDVARWIQRGGRHPGLARSIITEWPRIPELHNIYSEFMSGLTRCLADAIDDDRRRGRVVTALPSQSVALMALWSAERAIYASMVAALGFSDTDAVADSLVAQHLQLVYGTAVSTEAVAQPLDGDSAAM